MDFQCRCFPFVSIVHIDYGFGCLLTQFHSLFILSLYKSGEPETQRMKWLFQTDYSGKKFPKNLRKPTLDALRTEPYHGEIPIITANRIFVTLTVIIFGLTKAALAYDRLNTAAKTLDWIFGIIISSMHVPSHILSSENELICDDRTYCLEMYQDTSADVWPDFFVANHQPTLVSGWIFYNRSDRFLLTTHEGVFFIWISSLFLFAMAGAVLWTGFWSFALFLLWQWQPLPQDIPSFPALLDDIHFLCCKTLAFTYSISFAVAGMWVFFQMFNFILGEFLWMRHLSTFSRPRRLPRFRSSTANVIFSRYSQQLHELCE